VATLYACGITPYDATHIGHAATYTAWDLLVRAWLDARFTVVYVQNVTDVDDPLLERAARDHEDWRELARREIQRYREDMAALRVLPPAHLIGAVEALPIIDRFSARMADRGALYNVDEDVYFARSADPGFGSLSGSGTACGFSLSEMAELAGQRGGDPARPGKKDPLDVLVWRAERPDEPAWDSRFGRGRPGWHVECAAIATEYLGIAFDVQAGGSDLVFPHHEMSASHARVALAPETPVFARVYAHAGMVSYQGEKMSKSLGNLVFVSRLVAEGVDPMAIRMALLAHHYRSDWEWTDQVLGDAQARLDRWRAALSRAETVAPAVPPPGPAVPPPAPAAPPPGLPGVPAVSPPDSAGPPPAPAASPPGLPGVPAVSPPGPAGAADPAASPLTAPEATLAGVRARLHDDLDAPGALAIVDRWADALLAAPPTRITLQDASGARLVGQTVDALLGISL
jgi:L-cysteine:1D-myo-inositol 2-amino-2-deoxy-alpha-D-glucopyranoside ligase